jgi:peptidylprolyl isomerase
MRRLLALLAVLLLLASACGDDGDGDGDGAGTTAGDDAVATTDIAAVDVQGEFGEPPIVTFPHPFAVEQTVTEVIVEGDGDAVTAGASVGFHYVALNGRDGEVFFSSYESDPVRITADPASTVRGVVTALLAGKVGSRVVAAIAPADGFGDAASDAGVTAEDTVVFVVDILDVRHPLTRAEGTPVAPVAGLPTVTLGDDGQPTIAIPDGEPPADLVVQPLIEGTGAVVESGQTISAHYTGIVWATNTQFDSSWDRGAPADFPIGVGGVIDGWDTGLVGQKIGSQVLLVIPPDQGYGSAGNAGAGISGTDTLVFVVDILDAY